MNNGRHHIIQFTCIMALLSAIVVQGFTGVVKTRPISPFIDQLQVVKQDPTFEHYRDGSYQMYLAQKAWKKTGFREFFGRCYNQVAYTLFGIIANKNIVEGSHHELFLTGHLDDVTGRLLMERCGSIENAQAEARKNVEETLALIDTLRQHGTAFLFVFCPTKPAVYHEYMPKPYQDSLSDFRLTDYYVEQFKEHGIPHIDFYNHFISIKDSFPYPLYTRAGCHWAESTIPMVDDSIFRKIETITDFKLPSINYVDPNLSTRYSNHDCELETEMDLLFPLHHPKLPRPVVTLTDTLGKDRPNLLVVGDGYFAPILETCFLDAFNQWDYWMYNQTTNSSRPANRWRYLNQMYNAGEILEEADIVMAIYTSNYLFDYMNGFTQSAQELFQKGTTSEQEALELIKQRIMDSPEWMQAVEQQAKERGVTVEENLTMNAEYVLKNEKDNQANEK